MDCRVFDFGNRVAVLIPVKIEYLDKDTKKHGWENVSYFDCNFEDIPLPNDVNGNCLRCHWKADLINKKVIVSKTKDCEHDIFKRIKEKINNPDKQIALDGILELEKFKLKNKLGV